MSDALTAYVDARIAFVQQQNLLLSKNAVINQVKSNAQAGDLQQVQSELQRLRATISRHSPSVRPLVEAIEKLRDSKSLLEINRDAKRSLLDQQRQARFPQYETSVNRYLRKFGADFEVVRVIPDNRGAAPSVRFALKVNGAEVDVDLFKHTLSAGDRSTLALAYFFAMLDGQQNLAGTVVVLDDPFTSMDRHRASATVQEIRSLRTRVEQVIVLSHDGSFLWKIQESLPPIARQNDLSCIKLIPDGGWMSSRLVAWDIAEQERTLYDDNHENLRSFNEQAAGSPSAVAPLLRPVMEFYCRVAFPKEFPPGKLLGEFRSDELNRQRNQQRLLSDHDFAELSEITDYANKFHHATNPNYEQDLRNVNANELKSYVNRVLSPPV